MSTIIISVALCAALAGLAVYTRHLWLRREDALHEIAMWNAIAADVRAGKYDTDERI